MLSFHDFFTNLVSEPGLLGPPVRLDGSFVDRDYDMKKGLSTMRHGPDIKGQSSAEPPLISRPPTQASPSSMQPVGGLSVDDISSRTQTNSWPFASSKESNVIKSDKHLAQHKSFSLSNALPSQPSLLKTEEVCR